MDFPHLSRAPITEALMDIRVAPEAGSHEALLPFKQAVRDAFPIQNRLEYLRSNIVVPSDEQPATATTTGGVHGYICQSPDRLRIIQAHRNGFALSQLRPYENWATLRDQTRALWQSYRDIVQPKTVTRCAVRFINHLDLPGSTADFSKYLNIGPQLPSGMPSALMGVFMRVVLQSAPATAVITLATDEMAETGQSLSIILDIDVFENLQLAADADQLWDRFEHLRVIKNDVFFRCLTPAALELYR